MDGSVLIAVTLTFITVVISVVVFFAASHAARIQARENANVAWTAVDAEAYKRAQVIYEAAITQLETELARSHARELELQSEVANLQSQLSSLRRLQADMQEQLD